VLWLGLVAGAGGSFVSYLAATGAGGGLDEFVADPEPQEVAVDATARVGEGEGGSATLGPASRIAPAAYDGTGEPAQHGDIGVETVSETDI
jgi:hypothetical protein